MIELLFEDHTSAPYQITLCSEQVDMLLAGVEPDQKYTFAVYTKGSKKVLEMDAYYRIVDRIPYREPLGM